jgi:hypothetical protein
VWYLRARAGILGVRDRFWSMWPRGLGAGERALNVGCGQEVNLMGPGGHPVCCHKKRFVGPGGMRPWVQVLWGRLYMYIIFCHDFLSEDV